jgi:ABC-type nitrate/sulfonate/bicarbonate transport system ATPase subunit
MEDNKQNAKVQVKGLSKSFDELEVLHDVNFEIKKGEFVVVVGPTGCGKTTFLNLLTRLIEPTTGEILIDGERADPQKHNISFAFQEPSAIPWLTVEENIFFGLKIKKIPKSEADKRVNRIIELLGLQKYRKKYPHQLSVSCEQRVIIGRAFAIYPDLLLMDEPYGQMDIKIRYYLEDQVLKLWEELQSTIIFITHNIEEAVYLAQRIIVLTNKPTTVKELVNIDIPRPRDYTSQEFINMRTYITDSIKWW